jgi:hypothetical protein
MLIQIAVVCWDRKRNGLHNILHRDDVITEKKMQEFLNPADIDPDWPIFAMLTFASCCENEIQDCVRRNLSKYLDLA